MFIVIHKFDYLMIKQNSDKYCPLIVKIRSVDQYNSSSPRAQFFFFRKVKNQQRLSTRLYMLGANGQLSRTIIIEKINCIN